MALGEREKPNGPTTWMGKSDKFGHLPRLIRHPSRRAVAVGIVDSGPLLGGLGRDVQGCRPPEPGLAGRVVCETLKHCKEPRALVACHLTGTTGHRWNKYVGHLACWQESGTSGHPPATLRDRQEILMVGKLSRSFCSTFIHIN